MCLQDPSQCVYCETKLHKYIPPYFECFVFNIAKKTVVIRRYRYLLKIPTAFYTGKYIKFYVPCYFLCTGLYFYLVFKDSISCINITYIPKHQRRFPSASSKYSKYVTDLLHLLYTLFKASV